MRLCPRLCASWWSSGRLRAKTPLKTNDLGERSRLESHPERTHDPLVEGSNPSGPPIFTYVSVVQRAFQHSASVINLTVSSDKTSALLLTSKRSFAILLELPKELRWNPRARSCAALST